MENDSSSRRRLLQLGALGLTTSIAGCAGDNPNPNDYTDPHENNTDPEDNVERLPDIPPAGFKSPSTEYTYHDLPVHVEHPTDLTSMPNGNQAHPDNRIFNIEIQDANTAVATIDNVNVFRDIELELHIRDVNGTFQTVSQMLTTSENDEFTTRTVTFDISSVNLPRDAGSICELISIDTAEDATTYPRLLKRHQFVGVEHKNGVEWINTERMNYTRYIEDGYSNVEKPRGIPRQRRSEPAGHTTTMDGPDERTVILAVRTPVNGEVYGVSCHIDHEPYNNYVNGSERYQYRHDLGYECRFATEISHLRELATKTANAIDGIGITNPHDRLEALGDLVQMILYNPKAEAPPTIVLYDRAGDCSEKSALMSSLIQNDPWNMMPAFIDCSIDGVRHWTIGIDVDDLGDDYDTTNNLVVSPTQSQINDGFKDTEYVFYDMTYNSYIGERTPGVEGYNDNPIALYDEGDFVHRPGRISTNPPNY